MLQKQPKANSIFRLRHLPIFDVAIIPGTSQLVCARWDEVQKQSMVGTLEHWDIQTGRRLGIMHGPTDSIRLVSPLPDSAEILTLGADHTLRCWDLEKQTNTRSIPCPETDCRDMVVFDDGHRVLVANDNTLRIVSLKTGKVLKTFNDHSARILGLALLPDGKSFISASADRCLILWDLKSGTCVRRFSADKKRAVFKSRMGALDSLSASAVCVLPGGAGAVSTTGDGRVCCWDLDSGNMLGVTSVGKYWITSIAPHPSGTEVLIGTWTRDLFVWDLNPEHAAVKLGHHFGEVSAVQYTDDGTHAVTSSFDETLCIWDMKKRAWKNTLGEPRESSGCPPDESEW